MVAHDRVEENRDPGEVGRNFILASVCLLLLLVYWGLGDFDPQPYGTAAIDGSEVELFAPTGGSPVLVFFVAALLLFGRRKQLAAALGSAPSWLAGGTMLAAGAALERWGDYVDAAELLVPSLILLLLGSASLAAGSRGLRAIATPALFLIFAFPLPAVLVNIWIWPLQLHTATTAHAFLRLIGYAPEILADVIVLGGHSFQVIETCSGMRMIETLIMAACLYSILFYRRRAQVVLLIAAAPAIGYFVNFVRVISIIFNPYAEWATIHTLQGVVMLVIGVLMIAGLDSALERWQPAPTRRAPVATPPTHAARFSWTGIASVIATLSLLLLGNLTIPRWQPSEMSAPRAFTLPGVLEGSKPKPLKLDRQFLGSVGISNWLHREYTIGDVPVRIQILADDRLNRGGSLVSPRTQVPGRGYVEVSRGEVALFRDLPDAPDVYVDRFLYESPNQQTLVYHWREGIADLRTEIVRNALVLDRGPTRRNTWALSIRLSTAVTSDPGALEAADARLRNFAAIVRDALD